MANSGLREGLLVELDVGAGCELLPCVVCAFLGPAVLLMPLKSPSPDAAERLAAGAPAYLVVQSGDRLNALRGAVSMAGDALAVRITDDFRLGQRRWWSRAEVRLEARLVPLGGPAATETITADVSPGGVQVDRPAGMPVWPRYELILSGSELSAPVTAEAVPARAIPACLGLRFTRIDSADRQRLTEIVLRHRGVQAASPTPA